MAKIDLLPEPLRDPNNCWQDQITDWQFTLGYRASLPAGITFCVLFGFALLWHGLQSIRMRRWTSILLAVGAMTELIGWGGRTWAASCPYNQNAFLMQITTLIIAPVFFTGALYVLLGVLIKSCGTNVSILSPRTYTIVFVVCDVVSLVLQAVGGAMASISSGDGEDPKLGTDIMIGGVIFQLVAMTIFTGFVLDFMRRLSKYGIPRQYYGVLAAMFVALVAIFARNIFRAVELTEGWSGYLMHHEEYFIALDGSLMAIAVGIFVPLDPAKIVPRVPDTEKGSAAKASYTSVQQYPETSTAYGE